jgi:hypothetical protein
MEISYFFRQMKDRTETWWRRESSLEDREARREHRLNEYNEYLKRLEQKRKNEERKLTFLGKRDSNLHLREQKKKEVKWVPACSTSEHPATKQQAEYEIKKEQNEYDIDEGKAEDGIRFAGPPLKTTLHPTEANTHEAQ